MIAFSFSRQHRCNLAVLLTALAIPPFAGCFDDPPDVLKIICTGDKTCPSGYSCAIPSGQTQGKCVNQSPSLDGATPLDSSNDRSSTDQSTTSTFDGPAQGLDLAQALDVAADAPIPSPDSSDASLEASVPDAPSTGGATGTGGNATGTGGASGTGGNGTGGSGTGGTSGTGGNGSGGSGTGGATCQLKSRDCTSSLDNDCNGTPDKQETTYCACPVGQSRACQEHPGYDGVGLCKAGSQTCAASGDKTTSSWGECSGAVGPSTRNCTSSADNDCNGTPDNQETAYCQCLPATSQSCLPPSMCTSGSQTCTASSDKTTTSWGSCTGYTSPSIMYRDYDGDGYGDPLNSNQVCSGASGYVSNNDDCDDSNNYFRPGVSICGTVTQKKTCTAGGHGVASTETCDQGCINGNCRTDGTIGLPGYVTCLSSNSQRCLVGDGCKTSDGTCGVTNTSHFYCDGPNDCPGQECWLIAVHGWIEARCQATRPEDSTVYRVCDPLASLCALPFTCIKNWDYYPIYVCN
jgi:hypothetical protein